jgi:hypothetical protein
MKFLIAIAALGIAAVLGTRWAITEAFDNDTVAAAGSTVTDSGMQFRVTDSRCGPIPPTPLPPGAEGAPTRQTPGQWCRVTLDLKNTGAGVTTFTAGTQTAYAGDYGYKPETVPSRDVTLKPGFTGTATLYYEVAPGVVIDRLELHGGDWASGATYVAVTPTRVDDARVP